MTTAHRDVKTWEEQDPEYEAFFRDENNAPVRDLLEGGVKEIRERLQAIGAASPVPNIDDLDMENINAGNFQVQLYRQKERSGKQPIVVAYHGGGDSMSFTTSFFDRLICTLQAGFVVRSGMSIIAR